MQYVDDSLLFHRKFLQQKRFKGLKYRRIAHFTNIFRCGNIESEEKDGFEYVYCFTQTEYFLL